MLFVFLTDAQSTASDIFPDESDVASLCSQDVASLLDSPSELQPQGGGTFLF